MWQYQNTDELYHHGVLGMKWGIRRYQNKDGTLTSAGRKKANKLAERYAKITGKKIVKTSKNSSSDNVKNMSDAEIHKRIDRLKLENRYKELMGQPISKTPKQISNKGQQYVKNNKNTSFFKKTISSIGRGVQEGISDGAKNVVSKAITRTANKIIFGEKGDNNKRSNKSDTKQFVREISKDYINAAKEFKNDTSFDFKNDFRRSTNISGWQNNKHKKRK